MSHQTEILRETVYRLAQVMDSFSDVRLSMNVVKPDEKNPGKDITQHTEFTITRTTSKKS